MHCALIVDESSARLWNEDEQKELGRIELDHDAYSRLQEINTRYAACTNSGDAVKLLQVGKDLYEWLDNGTGGAFTRLVDSCQGKLVFEVRGNKVRNFGDKVWAVLNAPWEVLANGQGFLALDAILGFAPCRRLGAPGAQRELSPWRLGVLFMAAAPTGAQELDHEKEELGIIQAVGHRDLDLVVEESGNPELLAKRMRDTDALQVVHVSCHGHNAWKTDGADAPVPTLFLEDEYGDAQPTTAERLVHLFGDQHIPGLLFLSACLSARAGEPQGAACATVTHSMAANMIQSGFPAVLGWDGSVLDSAASSFAAKLYAHLANWDSLEQSASMARREMLQSDSKAEQRDWHLPRIWLGKDGGGPIVGGNTKRSLGAATAGHKDFLDIKGEKVPVAPFEQFVGRRREIQTALRVLWQGEFGALALLGMGRLGKSSLAARIANRLRHELQLVVVFGQYDGLAILEAIGEALSGNAVVQEIIARHKPRVQGGNENALAPALHELLQGPCESDAPILLVVDDLESILGRESRDKQPVHPDYEPVLRALVQAFAPDKTESRLLFTSRYPFDLQGLEKKVFALEIPSFPEAAQHKLLWRQQEQALALANAKGVGLSDKEIQERLALLGQALELSRYNPGLQDLLGEKQILCTTKPLGLVKKILVQMRLWLEQERESLPDEPEIREFFESLALDALLEQAGEQGRELLDLCLVFHMPVPEEIIVQLGHKVGGDVARLRGLQLFDVLPDVVNPRTRALQVNPLVASRLHPWGADTLRPLLQEVLPRLFTLWGGEERSKTPMGTDIELTRLALIAKDVTIAKACGVNALRGLEGRSYQAAAMIGQGLVELYDKNNITPQLVILTKTAASLADSGDGELADNLFERAMSVLEGMRSAGQEVPGEEERALLLYYGDRLQRQGEYEKAQHCYERAAQSATKHNDEIMLAQAKGKIADILFSRGDLDEALRIRVEEQLPVYSRLGDVRSLAVTQGKIADILFSRGDLDEALRIRVEEQLPVYSRLGDVRSLAVTQGKIADILYARGELDEVLRIRREEEMPVYSRLGDVHSLAVTQGQIADILFARGDVNEALRIRQEEQLPVYSRLGDARELAVTQGQIADILFSRGDLDEALRIRREEEMPVYSRLGDVRSLAVTQGKIADILVSRGDLDEALRIRQEQQLPVYSRLGDVRELAVTQGNIAGIHFFRGDLDEALRLYEQEVLPVLRQLKDMNSTARVLLMIAKVLMAQEKYDKLGDYLPEAYALFNHLGNPDGIFETGSLHGQLLCATGQEAEGMEVLEHCLEVVKGADGREAAAQLEALIQQVRERLQSNNQEDPA